MHNINIFKISYDRVYGMETFFKLVTPNNRIDFKLSNQQEIFVRALEQNDKVLVQKHRQFGLTTTSLGFLVLESVYKPKSCIGILSGKMVYLNNHNSMVLDFIKQLENLTNESLISSYTKGKIVLTNGSVFLFSNFNIRGYALSHCFIDEYITHKELMDNYPNFYNSKLIIGYTYKPSFLDDFMVNQRVCKLSFKWYYDDRFNKDLYWITPNGFKLYEEKIFSEKSVEEALSLGLEPMSSWKENLIRQCGKEKVKEAIDLDVL